MKIRTDFVTNSSSVSYIITMDSKVVEKFNELGTESEKSSKRIILDTIFDDMKENGTKIDLDERETYIRKYVIRPKADTMYDSDIEEKDIDFSTMSNEDLWKYINGEYFVNLRIESEYKGFSCLLLPHEVPEIRTLVVVMSQDGADMLMKNHFDSFTPKRRRIFNALYKDLKEGSEFTLGEISLKAKSYTYHIKNDCLFEDSFEMPIEEVDFEALSDDDIWKFIKGEYFLNQHLNDDFFCFSFVPIWGMKK